MHDINFLDTLDIQACYITVIYSHYECYSVLLFVIVIDYTY